MVSLQLLSPLVSEPLQGGFYGFSSVLLTTECALLLLRNLIMCRTRPSRTKTMLRDVCMERTARQRGRKRGREGRGGRERVVLAVLCSFEKNWVRIEIRVTDSICDTVYVPEEQIHVRFSFFPDA